MPVPMWADLQSPATRGGLPARALPLSLLTPSSLSLSGTTPSIALAGILHNVHVSEMVTTVTRTPVVEVGQLENVTSLLRT